MQVMGSMWSTRLGQAGQAEADQIPGPGQEEAALSERETREDKRLKMYPSIYKNH